MRDAIETLPKSASNERVYGESPRICFDPFDAQIMFGVIVDYLGKGDQVNVKSHQTNADVRAKFYAVASAQNLQISVYQ